MVHQPFLDEVSRFRTDLQRASGWEELRALWRRSIAPYRVASRDPLSPEYRAEILDLYQRMTGVSYDLDNEFTSTKVPPADFARGYPWMTNNFGVAASEVVKVAQAFRVLEAYAPKAHRIVEFGSGWANLALALAQVGRDVTAVDIDAGFIRRTEDIAQRQGLNVHTVTADFLTAARACNNDFDAAVFQSSFHHCMDFNELLGLLRTKTLKPDGRIFFFSEPVFGGYPFPWGLRTDGESLWAITLNKWCELGFDRDFFVGLLHAHGFLGTATGAIPGVLGDAWVATPAEMGLPFEDWALPARHDETFHPAEAGSPGRFLRERSTLPVPGRRRATLSFANFGRAPLTAAIVSGAAEASITLQPDTDGDLTVEAGASEIALHSSTFVPNEVSGNGDTRRVGLTLRRVRFD